MRRPASRRDVHRRSPAAAKCPDIPFPDDRSRGYRVRHQKKASSIPRMERICIQWPGDRISGWLWRALWADVCSKTAKGGRPRSEDDKASHQWTSTKIDGPFHWIPHCLEPIALRRLWFWPEEKFRRLRPRSNLSDVSDARENSKQFGWFSVHECIYLREEFRYTLQFRNSAWCMVHRVLVCEVIAQASYESD